MSGKTAFSLDYYRYSKLSFSKTTALNFSVKYSNVSSGCLNDFNGKQSPLSALSWILDG